MTNPILDHLAAEWHDAADWFRRHHPAHPYDEHQQPHQEEPMSLADIAGNIRKGLQDSAVSLHDVLDNHVAQLDSLAAYVAANPAIQAAERAGHVPPQLLQVAADMLDGLAAAHPRPEAAAIEATAEAPAQ